MSASPLCRVGLVIAKFLFTSNTREKASRGNGLELREAFMRQALADWSEYPWWICSRPIVSGDVSMRQNSDRQSPRPGPSMYGEAQRPFSARETLKAYLRQLEGKLYSSAAGNENMLVRGARLNSLCERVLDAYTLQQALQWERRIVDELTAIIDFVAARQSPIRQKADVMFDLLHDRAAHNRNIMNIEMALARNDTVAWMR